MLGLDNFFGRATKGAQPRDDMADVKAVQPVPRVGADKASFADAGGSSAAGELSARQAVRDRLDLDAQLEKAEKAEQLQLVETKKQQAEVGVQDEGKDPEMAQALASADLPILSETVTKQEKEPTMTTINSSAEQELDRMLAEQADIAARVEAKRQELKVAALADMREKITRYGVTAAELGFTLAAHGSSRSQGGERASGERRTSNVEPRYLDPESGKTWSGRGRTPVWLRDKADKEQYRIKKAA